MGAGGKIKLQKFENCVPVVLDICQLALKNKNDRTVVWPQWVPKGWPLRGGP